VGTVAYMSPEQARGEELDARSDIFSLGCVIYEMAAGRRAFEGKTPAVVFHAILERDPAPLREANPGVPAKLEEIVAKALEKDREMRYQTAAELRADLKRLKRDIEMGRASSAAVAAAASTGEPAVTPPSTPEWGTLTGGAERRAAKPLPERGRNRRAVIIRLLMFWAVVIAAVLGYRLLLRNHKPATGPESASSTGDSAGPAAPFSSFSVTRLTSTGDIRNVAVSRDGKYLAYVTVSGSQEALFIRQITTRSTVQLVAPKTASLGSLAFSPDGLFVYYVQQVLQEEGSYYQIPFLGGAPRLAASGVLSDVALSFDGNKIAYIGRLPGEDKPALLIAGIDEKAEAPRALLKDVDPSAFDALAWSPGGQTLALLESHPDPSGLKTRLMTISISDGTRQALGASRWRSATGGLAWLPDGSGLMFNGQDRTGARPQVWYVSFPAGAARQVSNDLLEHYINLSVTGDGKAFVGILIDVVSNLWTASKGEDKSERQVTTGRSDGMHGFAWMVDGRLVYASYVTGYHQLWITGAQGGAPRQLTADPKYHVTPTVCRGADRAFYISDASGSLQLWSVGIEDGQVKQETNAETPFFRADCAPDGSWLAGLTAPKGVAAWDESKGKLTRLDRASGQMRVLFDGNAWAPRISPDGKHIAFLYQQTNGGAPRVGIVSAAGGPLEKSLQVPQTASSIIVWAPDGHAVDYLDHGGNSENVWAQPLDGGKPKQLTHFAEGSIWNMAWSRDGKTLALARGSFTSDAVMFTSTH